jgi:asparagine synthetase B (glutamine-hydrolysing)
MTLIAGVVCRAELGTYPEISSDSIKASLTRRGTDPLLEFKTEASYIAKLDVGAFREPAVYEDRLGRQTLVTGEPLLLSDSEEHNGRLSDTKIIHEAISSGDWRPLAHAQGVFAGVSYSVSSRTLTLLTDKLGIRPLYFYADADHVYFSSVLRVLEAIPGVRKRIDLRAATEVVGFGYPLDDRTGYLDVFLLRPGEVVTVTKDRVSREFYWRWDAATSDPAPEEQNLDDLYTRFNRAVSRRLGSDKATAAFLSGGLDSRCVVAALASRAARTFTFNFAQSGTLDAVLGNGFAEQIGTTHVHIPKDPGDLTPDYSGKMAAAWSGVRQSEVPHVERPQIVWSGEGGSVALGHVHLNERLVALMRSGDVSRSIEDFFKNESIVLPAKLYKSKAFAELKDVLTRGAREELSRFNCADPARNFYLFLLHNDQRRKLSHHFENIDLHRLEFQLPFFDSDLISSILSIPIDRCLRHKLYNKWLTRFPAVVAATPWQSYPNHEPCPHLLPEGLAYQWASGYQSNERRAKRRSTYLMASKALGSPRFPAQFLDKQRLRAAAWAHLLGWRDCEHIIRAADIYLSFLEHCEDPQ